MNELLGATSFRKALNFDVWAHCYLKVAHHPDPFFPPEFENVADVILLKINLSRDDITYANASAIYQYLVSVVSNS